MNASSLWEAIAGLIRNIRPWQTVRPWEKGLRIRCGRWVTEKEPGFYYKLPILDSFLIVNTRLRICSTQMYTVLTEDRIPVSVSCKVGYRVEDPLAVFKRFQQPDWTVNLLAARALTRYTSYNPLEDIEEVEVEEYIRTTLENEPIEVEWVALTDFVNARTYRLLQHTHRPGVHGEQATEVGY